jgi:hypothetical protein
MNRKMSATRPRSSHSRGCEDEDGEVQADAQPFTRPHQAESGARRKQHSASGAGQDQEEDSDQEEELFQDAEEGQRGEALEQRASRALRIADDEDDMGGRVAESRAQRNIVINTVQVGEEEDLCLSDVAH